MSAARTIAIFAAYLALLGAALLIVPNLVLTAMGVPTTEEPWLRIVGLLCIVIAGYYAAAARSGVTPLFRWSVPGRLSVLAVFVVMVLAGMAPPVLLLFGIVDAAAALATWRALRREDAVRAPS